MAGVRPSPLSSARAPGTHGAAAASSRRGITTEGEEDAHAFFPARGCGRARVRGSRNMAGPCLFCVLGSWCVVRGGSGVTWGW